MVNAKPQPASDNANCQSEALQNPVEFNPDLQLVIKGWDTLPEAVRAKNVSTVKATRYLVNPVGTSCHQR